MADKAIIGYGATFERGTGSPLAFTEVARVVELGAPNISRDAVETTHLKSTSRYKEFIAGMRDGGEVSLTIVYNPENATHTSLKTDFDSNELGEYRVTIPSDTNYEWTFQGLITSMETPLPMDDKVTQAITIKVTGVVTFASA